MCSGLPGQEIGPERAEEAVFIGRAQEAHLAGEAAHAGPLGVAEHDPNSPVPVVRRWPRRRLDPPDAVHFQVHVEGATRIEANERVFTVTHAIGDALAGEVGIAEGARTKLAAGDLPPGQGTVQSAGDPQQHIPFRHGRDPAAAPAGEGVNPAAVSAGAREEVRALSPSIFASEYRPSRPARVARASSAIPASMFASAPNVSNVRAPRSR